MNKHREPVLLTVEHDFGSFDCGDDRLNEWLRLRALRNQHEGTSRTWVLTDDRCVVAFYASSASGLDRDKATRSAARNQPELLPAVLLARLAVDRDHQGTGRAATLLKHFLSKSLEVAALTGVRILLVHAKDNNTAEFYRHFGFAPSPIDKLTLMLLVKKIPAQI